MSDGPKRIVTNKPKIDMEQRLAFNFLFTNLMIIENRAQ